MRLQLCHYVATQSQAGDSPCHRVPGTVSVCREVVLWVRYLSRCKCIFTYTINKSRCKNLEAGLDTPY